MKVVMLQDVEKVGMIGQVVKVSDGYALNFLIPRKLAVNATSKSVIEAHRQTQKVSVDKKVLQSKVAMLAERIKNLHLSLRERAHDEGKLYGAVGQDEIVELLKKEGVVVNRKQIEFAKAIRTTGEHKVTIRLSSKLKPTLTLKIVASEEK
jgi:large subunit ribosomal protein L9